MNFRKVLFPDVDLGCQYLSRKIMGDNTIDRIYGTKYGGFIVSLLVSRYSRKPLIYEEKQITENTLIVADVIYSWDIIKRYSGYKIACLYKRRDLHDFLYFVYRTIPEDIVLIFCWESEYNNDYEWFNEIDYIKNYNSYKE